MERGPEKLRLVIPGQAAGAGSKTAMTVTRGRGGPIVWRVGPKILPDGQVIGVPMLNYTHASKKTGPWMKIVEATAAAAWGSRLPMAGSLWLDVWFYELRPASHYFKRKSGRVLRPDAPAYPDATENPDVDKLRRAISDSLTNAAVLADDKRVVGGEHWKDFSENVRKSEPFVVICLGEMVAQTVEDLGLESPPPTEGQEQLLAA